MHQTLGMWDWIPSNYQETQGQIEAFRRGLLRHNWVLDNSWKKWKCFNFKFERFLCIDHRETWNWVYFNCMLRREPLPRNLHRNCHELSHLFPAALERNFPCFPDLAFCYERETSQLFTLFFKNCSNSNFCFWKKSFANLWIEELFRVSLKERDYWGGLHLTSFGRSEGNRVVDEFREIDDYGFRQTLLCEND